MPGTDSRPNRSYRHAVLGLADCYGTAVSRHTLSARDDKYTELEARSKTDPSVLAPCENPSAEPIYEELDRSSGRVLGSEIRGEFTEAELNEMLEELEAVIHEEGAVRLLVHFPVFPSAGLSALDEDPVSGSNPPPSLLLTYVRNSEKRERKWGRRDLNHGRFAHSVRSSP